MDLEQEISFDKRMYGIKDVKTGKFIPPFLCDSDGEAKRAFSDIVTQSNESLLARHPEDYDLFYLGGFDTVTGIHTGTHAEYIMNAQQVVDDYRRKFSESMKSNISQNSEICTDSPTTYDVA